MTGIVFSKVVNDVTFSSGSGVSRIDPAATAHDTLLYFHMDDTGVATITWPSGFSQIFNQVTTTDSQLLGGAIKADATGSEGSISASDTGAASAMGSIIAFSGVDKTNPLDISVLVVNNNTGVGSPWSISSGSFTPATPGAKIVVIMGSDVTTASSVTHSFATIAGSTSAWIKHTDIPQGGVFDNMAIASCDWTSGAVTVQGTGTAAGITAGCAMAIVVLRPILAGPTINTQPTNQTSGVGSTASFSVSATTTGGTLTYQWYVNAGLISGATSSSYTTPTLVSGDNGGAYYCAVSDSNGTTNTSTAVLTVLSAPRIDTQPTQQTAAAGVAATFSVAATTSLGSLSYQWYSAPITSLYANVPGSWTSISGATSNSYTTGILSSGDNGKWFYCAVTDSNGTTNSFFSRAFITGLSSNGKASAIGQFGSFNAWAYSVRQHRTSPAMLLRKQMWSGNTDGVELTVLNNWFWTSVTLTAIRALILSSGKFAQVTNAQIGTGLKPIVWYSSRLQERSAAEGTPVVWDGTTLRLMNSSTETLTL